MQNVNEVRAQLVNAVEAARGAIAIAQTAHDANKNKKKAKALAKALAEAQGALAIAEGALAEHDAQQQQQQNAQFNSAYRAEYTIPQVARPAAGAPAPDVNSAPKGNVSVPHNGAYDALKGRVGARTHIMHVILCEAYARGERLTASTITARVNVVWARALAGAHTTEAATASHLNTMKRRGYYANGALTKRAYLALTRGVAPETIPASECE